MSGFLYEKRKENAKNYAKNEKILPKIKKVLDKRESYRI